MSLTEAQRNDLRAAHSFMRNTPYVPDTGEDYWEPATPSGGDCEDIVLSARRLLMGRGWDYRCLLVTLVRTPRGDPHCVLMVVFADGEILMDSEVTGFWLPASYREAGYRFVMRQSPENPAEWEVIE